MLEIPDMMQSDFLSSESGKENISDIIMMLPGWQVAGQTERNSCSRYELDSIRNLSAMGTSPNWMKNQSVEESMPEVLLSNLKQEGCKDGWTYSTEYFNSTVVTEVYHCPSGI